MTLSEPRPTEQTSLHNEDIHASQPVSKSPQLVPKSPQPAVVPFSIPSHDLKKYQVADDDRLPPVTTTMTAVAVCGEQSEYSKPGMVTCNYKMAILLVSVDSCGLVSVHGCR